MKKKITFPGDGPHTITCSTGDGSPSRTFSITPEAEIHSSTDWQFMTPQYTALTIALDAHEGQTDKGGAPYMAHVLYVSHAARRRAIAAGMGQSDIDLCETVGLLHDVIEDSRHTRETIEEKMGAEVAEHVDAMSHYPHQGRLAYLKRIGAHYITRTVKMADLEHNSKLERIPNVREKDRIRSARYAKEIEFLSAMVDTED